MLYFIEQAYTSSFYIGFGKNKFELNQLIMTKKNELFWFVQT